MPSTSQTGTISTPLIEEIPKTETEASAEKNTYDQILKSSALIGGSSVISIAIRMVRTKAMAVLLGPAGFGLMGLYDSIINLAQSITGLGVSSSGVRQIAESVGTGDSVCIDRTVVVLRRISLLLGILGAASLLLFSRQVSILTFDNEQHTGAVMLLSLALFFRLVSAGQGALIQGMRRIGDLAIMGVLSALFGTVISVPLVYLLREEGVAPALVGIAALMLFFSWWYSRKIRVHRILLEPSQFTQEAASLLKLGFVFMASGFFTMGAAYAVRIIITRKIGLEAAGFYQSAWTLGGLYVGFIFQAMGADFFPRLTEVASDNKQCNKLVNEQALVSLLLSGPGVIGTLTFASVVIEVFYSPKFSAAVVVLRWICLGMFMRVITWPMGFIIVAKNEKILFFLTELSWTVVNVGLSWICVKSFGLNGAGIAFFGSYVFHGLMIYPIVRHLSGFRWSAANVQTGMIFLCLIAIVFYSFYLLPPFWAIGVGLFSVILSGAYLIRTFLNIVPFKHIPQPIKKFLIRLGLTR